ncbi:MAG: dTDP-glucose 4,6-dehydratase [Planctomycetes bacterium RIFCSPLOWO2_02_FULL_50_16]|nr:MAG: dTDP-glucose 4,6-dehydratase [Planctomycetes bacterium RIFCSPLOWO2_02_FULL_50_16]
MNILVTGGAGFIGSNFIRYLLGKDPDCHVTNLDKLTYCGNLENLADIENMPNYRFVRGDVTEVKRVEEVIRDVDCVINFAAETHVDRSIMNASEFIMTDAYGTYVLLEAARKYKTKRFLQISTDEVYGSIPSGAANEEDRLNPSNPYSASKAGADLLARSYYITYDFPVIVLRPSNNFGQYQYPEKLIPLFITNALMDMSMPLYGDGKNVRDWLYVEDTCRAIDLVLRDGKIGEVYNISGGSKKTNIEIAEIILKELNKPKELIKFVKDRPGHDRRYSIDGAKLERLGFVKKFVFEDAMKKTIDWYRQNRQWWEKIKSGDFKNYYKKQYAR